LIEQVASASFGSYVDAKNFWRLITMYLPFSNQQYILLRSVWENHWPFNSSR